MDLKRVIDLNMTIGQYSENWRRYLGASHEELAQALEELAEEERTLALEEVSDGQVKRSL